MSAHLVSWMLQLMARRNRFRNPSPPHFLESGRSHFCLTSSISKTPPPNLLRVYRHLVALDSSVVGSHDLNFFLQYACVTFRPLHS